MLPKISKNIKNLGREFDGHPYNEQMVGDRYNQHQQIVKVKKSKKKKSPSPLGTQDLTPLRQLSPLKPRYAITSSYLSGGYSAINKT